MLMQELSIDLIIGLPPAKSSIGEVVDAIIVVTDRFSKYVWYFAILILYNSRYVTDILAPEFLRYSIPKGIVIDRDPRYISYF